MNNKITMEDVKDILVMFQFENGEVIALSDLDKKDAEMKSCKIVDNLIDDGNKIKSIAMKAILKNENWVKTDGKSVASKNITDNNLIEYMAKMVNIMKPIYLEALNNGDVYDAMFKMHQMGIEAKKLAAQYGFYGVD